MLTNQSVLEASASLRAVISATTKGLVEREALVEMVALSAVAEEHVLVIGPPGTAKRVRDQCWTGSVPPRGSGWVRSHSTTVLILRTHPLPRGGTDPVQVRLPTCEIAPHRGEGFTKVNLVVEELYRVHDKDYEENYLKDPVLPIVKKV